MIKENDVIRSNKKISDLIGKDTEGVILSVYENGKAFLVEFLDKNGDTIGNGMETVKREDVDLLIKAKR